MLLLVTSILTYYYVLLGVGENYLVAEKDDLSFKVL
jgi:hypothetical protein